MPLTNIIPPDISLFFKRNDPSDPRLGEIVSRELTDKTKVAIVGVPQDIGVERNNGRTGAKLAPTEIRRALYKLTPYHLASGKSISGTDVVDIGNIDCNGTLEEIHERLEQTVHELVKRNIIPVVIGGGHDIAIANARGLTEGLLAKGDNRDLGVINIDTHLDVREAHTHVTSGTSFRMMITEDDVSLHGNHFVEFGIQNFAASREHVEWLTAQGSTIISLDEIGKTGLEKNLSLSYVIAAGKSERAVYVSFDTDAVRSSDAPGVSAPSPTGLTAEEFIQAALYAGRKPDTVLADFVEMNPKYDIDGRTAKLVALAIAAFVAGVVNRG